jgi:ubiquinone/menaquinone biosynthesis C-methylase UbiE
MVSKKPLRPDNLRHCSEKGKARMAFGEAQFLASDNASIPLKPHTLARLYGKVIGYAGFLAFYYYFKWPAVKQFINFKAKRTLEVGAGTGIFTFEVAKLLQEDSKILGLDIDEHCIKTADEIAKKGNFKNVEFVRRDLRSLHDWRRNFFDQILAFDILEHIDDDILALTEINAALEPHGLLVVSVPTPLFPRCFGEAWAEAIGHMRDGYSIEELQAKLENTGFRILRYCYYGKYRVSRVFVHLTNILRAHIPYTRFNVPRTEWFLPILRYLALFFDNPSGDARSTGLAVHAQKVGNTKHQTSE